LLTRAIESVRAQSGRPAEIIVVVDHNAELLARVAARFPDITVLPNVSVRGASGARNTGAFSASTPFIAFLDDDAAAEPGWLEQLLRPFAEPAVVGTGGQVVPTWEFRRPPWFPEEFDWVVGATLAGPAGAGTRRVRNVWAENMAVRADVFREVDGFRVGFGKVGAHSRPEDTDLCIRMAATSDAATWMYEDTAVVAHHVPIDRCTYRFFVRRCYSEGQGKAELAALLSEPQQALSTERAYVLGVLPRAVLRHLWRAARTRNGGEAGRAASIVVGLAATVSGFVLQKLVARREQPAGLGAARPDVLGAVS
jgi:glycosyltransferase involved in cell wall biosynthesis